MPDVFTRTKRSEVMSRIRSRGNKDTEVALIRVFRALGITGWRRQKRIVVASVCDRRYSTGARRMPLQRMAVRPDFVFPQLKVAVFVDGCFWHACPKHSTRPKGNATFWRKKLAANQERDRRVNRELKRAGWRVLRIWEHELARKNETRLRNRIRSAVIRPSQVAANSH